MKTIVALLLCVYCQVWAQNAPVKNPTVDQIIEGLAVPAGPKTRSLRNFAPQPRSMDFVIQFEFNSFRIKDDSMPALNDIVEAMRSPRLSDQTFNVEGHTDGVGSAAFNLELSTKRAAAVFNYLVQRGADKSKLNFEGKGFSELLVPDRPTAEENRRVRITSK
jgi:outer membrane protein OmpA-like peptidoglycan-associated protein